MEQHHGSKGPGLDAEEAALRRRTRQRALIRWLINLAMAVVIESIYLFISYASSSLLKSKVPTTTRQLRPSSSQAALTD